MKRDNTRENASKWFFTSNLRYDAISCLAVRESSGRVTWSGGGWEGRWPVFSPYCF